MPNREDPACVITGCHEPIDNLRQVQLARPVAPYQVWVTACGPHLERLAAIGLPVRLVEGPVTSA